jgi:hypothetical protein
LDRKMMTHCTAVAVRSGRVMICRTGKVVAISQAQKALGTMGLDDCVI